MNRYHEIPIDEFDKDIKRIGDLMPHGGVRQVAEIVGCHINLAQAVLRSRPVKRKTEYATAIHEASMHVLLLELDIQRRRIAGIQRMLNKYGYGLEVPSVEIEQTQEV